MYCDERNGWYVVVSGSESWRGNGGGSSGSGCSGGALEGRLHCRSGDVGSDATVNDVRDSGGRNLALSDFGGCERQRACFNGRCAV